MAEAKRCTRIWNVWEKKYYTNKSIFDPKNVDT